MKQEKQNDSSLDSFFREAQSELPQEHHSDFEAIMDCLLDNYWEQEDR
ncbi:MAG: hypothetical protein PUC66_05755 [Erysipelotrichaceae bacterium]|nr:hypothetical protein [Erysipelotrichaceae bacterium]